MVKVMAAVVEAGVEVQVEVQVEVKGAKVQEEKVEAKEVDVYMRDLWLLVR